jgi:hypothetical protein
VHDPEPDQYSSTGARRRGLAPFGAVLLFAGTSGLAALPSQTEAATHLRYMTTVNNGSVCHAINGNEADFLQRRATALKNLNEDTDIWTVCAVDLTIPSYDTDSDDDGQVDFGRVPSRVGYSVQVDMSTDNAEGVTGVCVLREVNPSGRVEVTLTRNLSMTPGFPASVVFGGADDPLELASALDPNAVTVACHLPRRSQINRILQVSYEIQEGFSDPPTPSILSLGPTSNTVTAGGGGGSPSKQQCPEGEVLIGLEGSWGPSFVNTLQGVCGKPVALEDGGNAEYVEFAGGATLPTRGVLGTSRFTKTCPAGYAVNGFSGRSGTYLDAIELHCGQLQVTGDRANAEITLVNQGPAHPPGLKGGPGGTPFGPVTCPEGGVATGLNLRSDAWIDRMGLVCAKPDLAVE